MASEFDTMTDNWFRIMNQANVLLPRVSQSLLALRVWLVRQRGAQQSIHEEDIALIENYPHTVDNRTCGNFVFGLQYTECELSTLHVRTSMIIV